MKRGVWSAAFRPSLLRLERAKARTPNILAIRGLRFLPRFIRPKCYLWPKNCENGHRASRIAKALIVCHPYRGTVDPQWRMAKVEAMASEEMGEPERRDPR